jgi:5-methylthioribose kinase
MESFELQSLKYHNDPITNKITLSVIDQLKLPLELEYIPILTSQDAWNTIRLMQVRGAPLIAIVAVLGISVDVNNKRNELNTSKLACDFLINQMTYLRTSRPTAVNLFRATDDLLLKVQNMSTLNMTSDEIINNFINASETLLAEDVATNKSIGDYGAKKILEITGRDSIRVLTICNTGSLATAGYGTALGVVRSLHSMGKLEHVYACETRPYNQGARLTAFEIVKDKLPGTLIGDSMASALMAVKGIDCVVVGADRVTSNGDTANKIGTYQLAIAAKYHGIPFFTAAPTTTLDLSMSSGSEIFVEERPSNELTSIFDRKIAPDGINVWNPSFDVTPCSLIRGVITEVGIAEANPDAGSDGIIDIPAFLASKGLSDKFLNQAKPVALPIGYEKLSESSIAKYVAKLSNVRQVLGINSCDDYQHLTVNEIGDGNLNFVYIITGPNKNSVIVKQALPYIRCIGESWPLTLKRASFETNALREERKLATVYVPEVYHFEESKAVIVMRYIEPPHIILRKGFMQGMRFSTLADDLSTFLANTLFGTSAICLDGGTFRSKVAKWSENTGLCALTGNINIFYTYNNFII